MSTTNSGDNNNSRRAYNRIGSPSLNNSNRLNSLDSDDGSDSENEIDSEVIDILSNTNNIMDSINTQRSLNEPLSASSSEEDEENPLSLSVSTSRSGERGSLFSNINREISTTSSEPAVSLSTSAAIIPNKYKITIFFLDPAQKKFELQASIKWTTKELKIEGERVHNVQPSQQRLISMGKLLQDDLVLEEQGIKTSGTIIHLFPKPNVIISNSPTNGNNNNNNDGNDNNNNSNSNDADSADSSPASPGAHVPQIVLDSEEVSRRGQILVLSSHEAYEAMHRVRLLSFLLLAYSTLQILRDVTIYLAPPEGYLEDDVIPPGDPTDTSKPSTYDGQDQLPVWQDRDYVELAISCLGVYVALLGMRATTEHEGQLTKRFLILLGVLGVSWTLFTFYCHVIYNIALEKALGESDITRLAVRVSMLETTLPFFMWVMFYIRAFQFYTMIREAELEASERVNTLLPTIQTNNNDTGTASGGHDRGRGNVNESYDLELQREDATIT